jgi:hypothetical protein
VEKLVQNKIREEEEEVTVEDQNGAVEEKTCDDVVAERDVCELERNEPNQ